MKYIIDTNSLLSLTRYIKPFDRKDILNEFLLTKLVNQEILLLDKVSHECNTVSKRIITQTFNFVKEKEYIINTDNLLPTQKDIKLVSNTFCYQAQKNKLPIPQFEALKSLYLTSADYKIILKGLELKNISEDVTIITEETDQPSDKEKKTFQKIPRICNWYNLNCINISSYLSSCSHEITINVDKVIKINNK